MERTKNNKKVRYIAIALPGIATSALAASHAAAEELSPLVNNPNSGSESGWFKSINGEMVWLSEEELKKRELAQVITPDVVSTVAEVTESGGFSEQLMKSLAWYSAGAGGLAGAALGALTSPAILQGPPGETGQQGPAGPQGPAGADGSGLKYNNPYVELQQNGVTFFNPNPSIVEFNLYDADGIDLSELLVQLDSWASNAFENHSVSHVVSSDDLISGTTDDYLKVNISISGHPTNLFSLGTYHVGAGHVDGNGTIKQYAIPVEVFTYMDVNFGEFHGAGQSSNLTSGQPIDFKDQVLNFGKFAAYGSNSDLTITLSSAGGETVIFGDGAALNGGQITIDLGADTFADKLVFKGRAEYIVVQNYDLATESKIDVPYKYWSGIDDGADIIFTQSADQVMVFEGLGGVGASLDPLDYFNEIYH